MATARDVALATLRVSSAVVVVATILLAAAAVLSVGLLCRWRKLEFNRLWRVRVVFIMNAVVGMVCLVAGGLLLWDRHQGHAPALVAGALPWLCRLHVYGLVGLCEPVFWLVMATTLRQSTTSGANTRILGRTCVCVCPQLVVTLPILAYVALVPRQSPYSIIFNSYDNTLEACVFPGATLPMAVVVLVEMVYYDASVLRVRKSITNRPLQRRLLRSILVSNICQLIALGTRTLAWGLGLHGGYWGWVGLAILVYYLAYLAMFWWAIWVFTLSPVLSSAWSPMPRMDEGGCGSEDGDPAIVTNGGFIPLPGDEGRGGAGRGDGPGTPSSRGSFRADGHMHSGRWSNIDIEDGVLRVGSAPQFDGGHSPVVEVNRRMEDTKPDRSISDLGPYQTHRQNSSGLLLSGGAIRTQAQQVWQSRAMQTKATPPSAPEAQSPRCASTTPSSDGRGVLASSSVTSQEPASFGRRGSSVPAEDHHGVG